MESPDISRPPVERWLIRTAVAEDCEEIMRLVKELAEYEKACAELSSEQLKKDGFGTLSYCECIVAEQLTDGQPSGRLVACALFYRGYSLFSGCTLHLRQLYVSPHHRRQGIASNILNQIATTAVKDGCKQLDFTVLSWNESALKFYKSLKAVDKTVTEQWHLFRVSEECLKQLAVRERCASPPSTS